jgi:hypothetical protein
MPGTNGATAAEAGTVAAVTSPSTGWASGRCASPVEESSANRPTGTGSGHAAAPRPTLRQLHRHGTTPTAPR